MATKKDEPMILEEHGEQVPVIPMGARYEYYDNLCVELIQAKTGEDYATLTVNITKLPDGLAAVDTNNHPNAPAFIEKYGLGEDTGKRIRSGYCEYPVYAFDMGKLKIPPGYDNE